MVLLFIEEGDRSFRSGTPDEEIMPGSLVARQNDKLVNATASTGVDGIAERPQGAWWGAEDDEDYRPAISDFTYAPDDLQPTPVFPLNEGRVYLRAWTPDDPGDGSDPPEYGRDMTLGVTDANPGRLVPEGSVADGTAFEPVGTTRHNAPEFAFGETLQEYHSLVHIDTL